MDDFDITWKEVVVNGLVQNIDIMPAFSYGVWRNILTVFVTIASCV